MVKGAALESVLLQQCPLSVAENFAVTVRDMNAVLLEKQQELLSRVEEQPLELPPPPAKHPQVPHQPEGGRKGGEMTAYKAAIQAERDAIVRRRRQRIQAQEDEDFRQVYRQEAVAQTIERHSQQQEPPKSPIYQPVFSSSFPISTLAHTSLPPVSLSPGMSFSSSSSSDSKSPHRSRLKRGVRLTQKLVDNS
jgi:hypothetical protein